MKLHIVRHGETIWHAENRYAGHTDVPLTDVGRKQAQQLIPWARSAKLDIVATSDLTRAIETATPLSEAIGLPLTVIPQLREVDFGQCDGLTEQEMREKYPAERAAFEAMPASVALPGGERGIDAVERALPSLMDLLRDSDNVLLVIHSTLGRLLLCTLLGINPNRYRSVFPRFANGAVTTLDIPRPVNAQDLPGSAALLTLNSAV